MLAEDALEEQLRLALKRLAKVVVEVGKLVLIGLRALQIPQVEPLAGEVVHERAALRVGEHAPHLAIEDGRVLQPALAGHAEQLIVRDRTPEEERQPRRELDIADRVEASAVDALSRSPRNTNLALARMPRSANWTPASKLPSRRPLS